MSNPWKLEAEAQALLAAADAAAAGVVRRTAAATDKEGRFPRQSIDALRAAGLLRLVSAKEVGGHGQGLRTAAAVSERVARECPSTAMILMMHYAATAVMEKHGSRELRAKLVADDQLTTLAFSESGSRSHFWLPVSTARRNGSAYKLNAAKQLITAAGHCDVYVWSSKPAEAQGLSTIWAVPGNAPGLSVSGAFDGLGLRGNSSAPIVAKDVSVSAAQRLGEDGQGFDIMMGVVMPNFSLLHCAVSVGIMEGVIARTVAHVTESEYSYDQSKLADLPQVRGHVARMRIKADLVRGFLLDALDALEQGREDAMLRVLESKVAGSETSLEVNDLAMRVCGGAAFRKDVEVERFFRDSRAATVMAPVSDALYDFIGKAVCGMSVF